MTPAEIQVPAGRQLSLPMIALFSVTRTSNRAVAHALDFDLVAVGETSEQAISKLRSAVKYHIEFGFTKNLADSEILQKAPDSCWEKLYNRGFSLGEDIEIDHQRIRTMTQVVDEVEPCASSASKA